MTARRTAFPWAGLVAWSLPMAAQEASPADKDAAQTWNWHAQNTDIVQDTPAFPADYSGPNSLNAQGEIRRPVSVLGGRLHGEF